MIKTSKRILAICMISLLVFQAFIAIGGELFTFADVDVPFAFGVDAKDNQFDVSFVIESGYFKNQAVFLTISEQGSKEFIYQDRIRKNKAVISGLEKDKPYHFEVRFVNADTATLQSGEEYSFTGQFKVVGNEKKHKVELITIEKNEPAEISILSMRYESENNDSMSYADIFYDDDDVYGYIQDVDDEDWFKIRFDEPGNANFWVDVPADEDYELYLYDEDGNQLDYSIAGTGVDELISLYPVEAGVYYYVQIYGYGSSYSTTSSYHLRAKNYPEAGSIEPDDYEPNDDFSSAESIGTQVSIYANIHDESDEDYYRFTLTKESEVDLLLLNIPYSTDYDLELYDYSGDVIDGSYNGGNDDESIYQILDAGTYYIRVYTYDGCSEDEYRLTLSCTPISSGITHQWYSQIEPSPNWDDTELDNVFFPNMSDEEKSNTPLEWNKYNQGDYEDPEGDPAYTSGHINMWGCVASSEAMVLKNLGASSVSMHYDLRYDETMYFDPDPFTIVWANIQYPSVQYVNGRYEVPSYTSSNSPTYMYVSRVANDFGYDTYRVDLSGKTAAQKASLLKSYLDSHPEGLMVRIASRHTLVFTRVADDAYVNYEKTEALNHNEGVLLTEEIEERYYQLEMEKAGDMAIYAASEYDDDFIVCDPGTQVASKGDNVNFVNSHSYSYGGLDAINYFDYFVER